MLCSAPARRRLLRRHGGQLKHFALSPDVWVDDSILVQTLSGRRAKLLQAVITFVNVKL